MIDMLIIFAQIGILWIISLIAFGAFIAILALTSNRNNPRFHDDRE